MIKVTAVQILGSPKNIDRQVACPQCSARAMAFEDGSIVCVAEGVSFAPEVTDGELYELRRQFDERNGITPADRLIIPAAMTHGFRANMPSLHERRPGQ